MQISNSCKHLVQTRCHVNSAESQGLTPLPPSFLLSGSDLGPSASWAAAPLPILKHELLESFLFSKLIFLEKGEETVSFGPDGLIPLLLRPERRGGPGTPLGAGATGEGISKLAPFLRVFVHQLLVNDPVHVILQQRERTRALVAADGQRDLVLGVAEMGTKRAVMRWSRHDRSGDGSVSSPDSKLSACCHEAFQGARKINHTILRGKLLSWSRTGTLCLLGTLCHP